MINCYLYHIHLDGMRLDEGYIGISTSPKDRWSAHKRSSENEKLSRALLKYGPRIKFSILASHDSVDNALWEEFCLRPVRGMGWNIAVGGGLPPNSKGCNNPNFGKTTPKSVRLKQSKARLGRFTGKDHPRARLLNIYSFDDNLLIAEGVVASTWGPQNGYHQAHLTATATGKLVKHKGVYARYYNESDNTEETEVNC